jgi:hypothetical protein
MPRSPSSSTGSCGSEAARSPSPRARRPSCRSLRSPPVPTPGGSGGSPTPPAAGRPSSARRSRSRAARYGPPSPVAQRLFWRRSLPARGGPRCRATREAGIGTSTAYKRLRPDRRGADRARHAARGGAQTRLAPSSLRSRAGAPGSVRAAIAGYEKKTAKRWRLAPGSASSTQVPRRGSS